VKKRMIPWVTAAVVLLCLANVAAAASHTMSWSFQMFNNPNARQVALNIAEKQEAMWEEDDPDDPVADFRDSLERRLYSRAQREIVDIIFDEEIDEREDFTVGDLDISVEQDPDTGETIITITDRETGEETVITYGEDFWPTSHDW